MRELLFPILERSDSADAVQWLSQTSASLFSPGAFELRPFYYAFSGVSRHFSKKAPLVLTPEDENAWLALDPEWRMRDWDSVRLARVLLLLHLGDQPRDTFLTALQALLGTADIRESVAIFSAYPLLPFYEELVEPMVDALRTNIVDIFDSIALDNAFPSRHFSEAAWNQMVLKSIFLGRPLGRILNADARANQTLAESVSGLAHERWAAGRSLDAHAWRFTQYHLTDDIVADLKRLVEQGTAEERKAVALVLSHSQDDRLSGEREQLAEELRGVETGEITWDTL